MNIKYLTKSGLLIEAEKAKPSVHRGNLRTLENDLDLKLSLEKIALEEIDKFILKFEEDSDSYMHSGAITFEMCKQAKLAHDSFHHGLAGSVLNKSLETFRTI